MLDRLRVLWIERPALVAAAVIAPTAFVITLVVLFAVVGGDDGAPPAAASLEQQQSIEQEQSAAAGQTSVVVKTGAGTEQEQDQSTGSAGSGQTDSVAQSSQQQRTQDEPAQEQPVRQSGQAQQNQQSQERPREQPWIVAGLPVVGLNTVLEEDIDVEQLKHGSDGSEGGILPIDNGVVVSSRRDQQTSWELIVPSAGMRSSVVRVGRTPSGAMGAPDNPNVIGWLDSSAQPGETGNTLLAGHRDYEDISGNVGTGVCWELINTKVGDQVILRDIEQDIYYVYTVTEAATVDPRKRENIRYLRDKEEPIVTLITCTGSFNADTHQYSHRLVVVGVLAAVASPDA